jgi:hypothetical protein
MQYWIKAENFADLTAALRAVFIPPWPKPGEVFQLTINGDAPECDPIQMVRDDGYDRPESWKHNGPKVAGVQTRSFKLVEIGYQPNFGAVKTDLNKLGKVPEGQWRKPLKRKFPDAPGRPAGIADPSWVGPDGVPYFPIVDGDGRSGFRWTGGGFGEYWLWLVELDK